MRFSTVTILAFIAYTSNQAIAAPIPPLLSEAIEVQGRHRSHSHGRYKSHARAPVYAEEDDEFAGQNGDPKDVDSDHPRHPGRHDRHHHYQTQDSEHLDHTQRIQARSPRTISRCSKRDLQDIEARSPFSCGHRKRSLQAIEAPSPNGDSVEQSEQPHDTEVGPPHHGHHHHHHHEHGLVPAYAHDLEEIQPHSPHGTGHPHHRVGHHRHWRHHHHHQHHQQHMESPAALEAEGHEPDNTAAGQSPGPAPSKRHLHNEDEDEAHVHGQHRHHNKLLRHTREKHTHGGHCYASGPVYAGELNEEGAEAHEDEYLSSEHEGGHHRSHQKRELEALFARDLQELERRKTLWKGGASAVPIWSRPTYEGHAGR